MMVHEKSNVSVARVRHTW